MKKLVLFILLSSFGLSTFVFAKDTSIDLAKLTYPPSPRIAGFAAAARAINSVSSIPVSAELNDTELSVYFDAFVGNAVITIYDADNNIVSQEVVDTYSTSEVFIPTDTWTSGNYTIKITYGTTILLGSFLIE